MAMNIGGGKDDDVMMDINTTPLIDVMLVLLVMLIITIPVQVHTVKLDLPVNQNQPPPPVPPVVVNLEVDFDGTLYWNGEQMADQVTLEDRLKSAALNNPQPEIHVRPNKLAAYKYVAGVMASAQRLGVTSIGLVSS